ncbi:MAG TPA: membrane protein insertion efficiency factor YidD, partial [Propionibacteriaceae bacterium]|nr:membrane protein insertion efficiency factor YidD [Propionibacteriaceae bacterium]
MPGTAWSRPAGGWRVVVRHSPLAWLMIGFVRLWRAVISPLYGDVC